MALPKLSPERRREIASALGIDEQYVYQVCAGLKTASPALARRMNALEPSMTLQDLRPADWREIWPELISVDGAAIAAPQQSVTRAVRSEAPAGAAGQASFAYGGRRSEDHPTAIRADRPSPEAAAIGRLVGTPRSEH